MQSYDSKKLKTRKGGKGGRHPPSAFPQRHRHKIENFSTLLPPIIENLPDFSIEAVEKMENVSAFFSVVEGRERKKVDSPLQESIHSFFSEI